MTISQKMELSNYSWYVVSNDLHRSFMWVWAKDGPVNLQTGNLWAKHVDQVYILSMWWHDGIVDTPYSARTAQRAWRLKSTTIVTYVAEFINVKYYVKKIPLFKNM